MENCEVCIAKYLPRGGSVRIECTEEQGCVVDQAEENLLDWDMSDDASCLKAEDDLHEDDPAGRPDDWRWA